MTDLLTSVKKANMTYISQWLRVFVVKNEVRCNYVFPLGCTGLPSFC
jgi:hypothetical protein